MIHSKTDDGETEGWLMGATMTTTIMVEVILLCYILHSFS